MISDHVVFLRFPLAGKTRANPGIMAGLTTGLHKVQRRAVESMQSVVAILAGCVMGQA